MDQDNPYNLQHFHDHNNQSLSDVRPFFTSVTGNQTHDAAAPPPSFQDLVVYQENSQKHMDIATGYDLYGQPLSIGSIENRYMTSQPTADGIYDGYYLSPSKTDIRPAGLSATGTTIYEGYDLPPSKTDIRPAGSSVTRNTTADQVGASQPFGQSLTSKDMKKIAPPDYYTQQKYKS